MSNCSTNPIYIEPDPDISGPGVLLSFIVTSAITFGVSMLGRILPCLPEPLSADGPRTFVNYFAISGDRKDFWRATIERFLRGLADQQLITGAVILVVGFSKWDITVYHFSIVCDLAWLSSSTHFSAMPILRDYFHTYRGARSWRVAIMMLMYVGLMFSTVLKFNDHWNDNPAIPARCLFKTTFGNITRPRRVLSLFFFSLQTTMGYFAMIKGLFKAGQRHSSRISEDQSISPQSLLKQGLLQTPIRLLLFRPSFSVLISIAFNTTWFALGLSSLYRDVIRGYFLTDPQAYNQLYTWGFGQLVPMLLIAIPLLTALEIFFAIGRNTEESACFKARREELRLNRLVRSVIPEMSGKIIEWQVPEGVAVGEDGVKEDFGGTPADLLRVPDSTNEKGLPFPPAVYKT